MQNKTELIKHLIDEKLSLEATVRQGELAKEDLEDTNVKLKKLMQEYLEEE